MLDLLLYFMSTLAISKMMALSSEKFKGTSSYGRVEGSSPQEKTLLHQVVFHLLRQEVMRAWY